MRQVALISSGAQLGSRQVCISSATRFAYCSTLAIYVHRVKDYSLEKILSGFEDPIMAIVWDPHHPDLVAVATRSVLQVKFTPLHSAADTTTPSLYCVRASSVGRPGRVLLLLAGLDVTVLLGLGLEGGDGGHEGLSLEALEGRQSPQHVPALGPHAFTFARVWDVEKEAAVLTTPYSAGANTLLMEWHVSDSKKVFLLTGSMLRAWDVSTGALSPGFRVRGATNMFGYGGLSTVTVLRMHPIAGNKMAMGLEDGTLQIVTVAGTEIDSVKKMRFEDASVLDVQWDRLSAGYLLVALRDGRVGLYDTDAPLVEGRLAEMTAFAKQPAGLRALAWVPTMPGSFLSGGDRAGVLRLWNVSQPAPLEVLRTGKPSGFHSLAVIPGTSDVLCSFTDGTVAVYSASHKRVEWSTEPGHTETIFDCAFCTQDANVLATASYDSSVRLWDVRSRKALATVTGMTGCLYALSWSPDAAYLAAGSSDGHVFIIAASRNTVVQRLAVSAKQVFCVDWSPFEPDVLAVSSSDGVLAIYAPSEGTLLRKFSHPAAVFGCAYSPFVKDQVAVGCDDGLVYLWDAGPGGASTAQQRLKGHTAKVFGCAWSPLLLGYLATSSDDCTARVWNLGSGECVALSGHLANVRGVMWHTEVPYVVVTSSWDASVRVWDARTGACLAVAGDHHADVYGLSSHPKRPFLLATSSRDSTVRLWTLEDLFVGLKTKVLLGRSDWRGSADAFMALGAPPAMCGEASEELLRVLAAESFGPARLAAAFDFLAYPAGVARLWELTAITIGGTAAGGTKAVMGGSPPAMEGAHAPSIHHRREVTAAVASRAAQLAAARHQRGVAAGGMRKEESLRAAAAAWATLGDLAAHCEALRDVGDWDAALAAAPGVSVAYWRDLVCQRLESLAASGAGLESTSSLYIATGQHSRLADDMAAAGDLDGAFVVAQVTLEGGYDRITAALQATPPVGGGRSDVSYTASTGPPSPVPVGGFAGLVIDTNGHVPPPSLYRQHHLTAGAPAWAACCHLSIDDAQSAVDCLVRGQELEMAALLGRTTATDDKFPASAGVPLAARLEAAGEPALARDILIATSPSCDPQRRVRSLACRVDGPESDVSSFYATCGLRPPAEYVAAAAEVGISRADAALCLLLARRVEPAVDVALGELRAMLEATTADAPLPWSHHEPRATPLLLVLHSVRCDALPPALREEMLAYCAYLGGLHAVHCGFTPIVRGLFETARALVRGGRFAFPVCVAAISVMELQYMMGVDPAEAARGFAEIAAAGAVPPAVRDRAAALLRDAQAAADVSARATADATAAGLPPPALPVAVTGRVVLPAAWSTPAGGSSASPRVSYISGRRITGPAVMLEDGRSEVMLGEAAMWARVNAFSPLSTGAWLRGV